MQQIGTHRTKRKLTPNQEFYVTTNLLDSLISNPALILISQQDALTSWILVLTLT